MTRSVTILALLPLAVSAGAPSKGWEFVEMKDDITTYRREVPGSPVIAIRGVGDVDAPILHVASVLMDTAHLPQWMDRVAEARKIRSSGALQHVEYSRATTPFPLTDRDFVVESWVDIDAAKKQIILKAHSVQDPSAPVTKLVRGEVLASIFTLTSLDQGKQTHVVAEVQTDPEGAIPKWIVNLVQKSWAHTTIMGLRRQVQRTSNTPDNSELKAQLEKADFFR